MNCAPTEALKAHLDRLRSFDEDYKLRIARYSNLMMKEMQSRAENLQMIAAYEAAIKALRT
jgi:hypothetical protein